MRRVNSTLNSVGIPWFENTNPRDQQFTLRLMEEETRKVQHQQTFGVVTPDLCNQPL
jgi:hypothetical protein